MSCILEEKMEITPVEYQIKDIYEKNHLLSIKGFWFCVCLQVLLVGQEFECPVLAVNSCLAAASRNEAASSLGSQQEPRGK